MDSKQLIQPSKGGYVSGQQIFVHTADQFNAAGQILTVNHDNHSTHVWALKNGCGTTVLRANTRPALPTDPGYMATFPEWYAMRHKAILQLSGLALVYAVLACSGWGLSIYLLARGASL